MKGFLFTNNALNIAIGNFLHFQADTFAMQVLPGSQSKKTPKEFSGPMEVDQLPVGL